MPERAAGRGRTAIDEGRTESDVQRARSIIRDDDGDEEADAWQPHPGLK